MRRAVSRRGLAQHDLAVRQDQPHRRLGRGFCYQPLLRACLVCHIANRLRKQAFLDRIGSRHHEKKYDGSSTIPGHLIRNSGTAR